MKTERRSSVLEIICNFICPALRLRRTKYTETDEQRNKRYDALVELWVNRAKQLADIPFFVEEADKLYGKELDRKSVVETKGTTLFGVTGLALTLTTIEFAFIGRQFACGTLLVKFVLCAVLVTILYFIGSGYYAVRATEILPFWMGTTYGFADIVSRQLDGKVEWAIRKLVQTEMNYDVTRIKTNYLSVSQSMLLRGLVVLTIATVFLFLALLTVTFPASNSTMSLVSLLNVSKTLHVGIP